MVGVVEGGSFDHGAGQQHRFKIGNRRDRARATDLVVYRHHAGEGLLSLELICYSPARGLRSEAQGALERHFVDLDDYAVGGERQCLAGGVPFVYVCLDFLDAVADAPLVGDRKAPALRGAEGLVMGLER